MTARFITDKNLRFGLLQLLVWMAVLFLAPILTFLLGGGWEPADTILRLLSYQLLPCMVLYFLNFYLFVPRLFFRDRKRGFVSANLLAIPVCNIKNILFFSTHHGNPSHPDAWIGLTVAVVLLLVLNIGSIGVAFAVRNHVRAREIKEQLAEEKQRRTEAELVWLKNQLNPHFLFNSLNNISSLVILDSDRAQTAIAQLSELLRYAMYESDKRTVPLDKEMEFMQNYIDLMSLRCGANTTVTCNMESHTPGAPIVPLLLISAIENAFKHGVSSNRPSFINITLSEKDKVLEFCCENSNFSKTAADRSGSGIGLANMRRRLELFYPDRYTWQCDNTPETYSITITLRL